VVGTLYRYMYVLTSGAGEATDEPGAQNVVHSVPGKVPKVDPERVRVLGEIQIACRRGCIPRRDGLHGAHDGDARVRGTLLAGTHAIHSIVTVVRFLGGEP
jgi:hypothetical protein